MECPLGEQRTKNREQRTEIKRRMNKETKEQNEQGNKGVKEQKMSACF
jgi:hypothetical protein